MSTSVSFCQNIFQRQAQEKINFSATIDRITQLFHSEMKLKFFENLIFTIKITFLKGQIVFFGCPRNSYSKKCITRSILKLEQSFLGQNGVEFRDKSIKIKKWAKRLKCAPPGASYLSASVEVINEGFDFKYIYNLL